MGAETREFQAEVRKLLDLMIHSLYSHKDVFLRELVSNASDALDRRRFAALTQPDLAAEGELQISLEVDPDARTLSIEDNGIGMSRSELLENLGTIAKSGTSEFMATLEESQKAGSPELIGQFGVGFYASFMVADRVTVVSRRAGEEGATRWESAGQGFEVDDAERSEPGTTIALTLKPPDADNGIADYTDEWVLRQIVKKYSDFVAHPIRLRIEGAEAKGGSEPLNSMKAIWTRPEAEIDEDEYREFYKHISHDWQDPLVHLSTRIEGNFEARALLYLPSVAPFDLYHREMAHKGIQLYVRRVFIMDECRELMPEHLRFVKGVVDAEDLPLNVSREMLQQDRQIKAIRTHLVKKVYEALAELKRDDASRYREFWAQFGPVLKEGLLRFDEKRERILELMLCASTHSDDELTSLGDAVSRMPEDQDAIYYLVGASREAIASSPHLEAFKEKGVEVLLFTDPVDRVWLEQGPPEFEGKPWKSVDRAEVDLSARESGGQPEDARNEQESEYKGLLAALRAAVQDDVKEVRLSRRLTTSPSCLVLDEGDLSPQMREILKQAGQDVERVKPILELNPSHPVMQKLKAVHAQNGTDPRIAQYAELLYGQAVLAEGGSLPDPAAFSRKLADVMERAL